MMWRAASANQRRQKRPTPVTATSPWTVSWTDRLCGYRGAGASGQPGYLFSNWSTAFTAGPGFGWGWAASDVISETT